MAEIDRIAKEIVRQMDSESAHLSLPVTFDVGNAGSDDVWVHAWFADVLIVEAIGVEMFGKPDECWARLLPRHEYVEARAYAADLADARCMAEQLVMDYLMERM